MSEVILFPIKFREVGAEMNNANISLIGMPGVGKSSVGILLAKASGRDFIDTDILIQNRYGTLLPMLIDQYGYDGFIALEAQVIMSLKCKRAVIAPGGSVVYSAPAMDHLKSISMIYYLELSLENLERRLNDMQQRGVLLRPGQSLRSLYEERRPWYEHYADRTIQCDDKNIEAVLRDILREAGR